MTVRRFTGPTHLKNIVGYPSQHSARPGDTITFYVHNPVPCSGRVVRLVDCPAGNERFEQPVDEFQSFNLAPNEQQTAFGSYMETAVPAASFATPWTLSFAFLASGETGNGREQVLVSHENGSNGYEVYISGAGCLSLRSLTDPVNHVMTTSLMVEKGNWFALELTWSAGHVTLKAEAKSSWVNSRADNSAPWQQPFVDGSGETRLLIATSRQNDRNFTGKIDHFRIDQASVSGDESHGATIANWDFTRAPASSVVVDVGPGQYHGSLHRLPSRASAGIDWDGSSADLRGRGSRSAIHFHEDDLEDAAWTESHRLTIPNDLPSGVYALRLEGGDEVEHVPFFISPTPTRPSARVAVVLPTYTYMAYANMHTDVYDGTMDAVLNGDLPDLCREEEFIQRQWRSLLGLSLYDPHVDGNSTVYSTRLRPMLHMRPHYVLWKTKMPRGFSADLILLGWLRRNRIEFDVLTDEVLDHDPSNALLTYDVVMTGDHPEYVTKRMRDRIADFIEGGGRLAYLGGNGFYWVTSSDPERPYFIEVRRGHGGTSGASTSLPGEEVHSLTGEQGGVWGYRGLHAQRLVGVGYTAAGWTSAAGYTRLPASRTGLGAKCFVGMEDVDVVGAHAGYPGIAGDEMDRADATLGTPSSALVLATSAGHHDEYYDGAAEDQQLYQGAGTDPGQTNIRADMVLVTNGNGGGVFSVGSIAWMLGLRPGLADTSASRVLGNVVTLFLSERWAEEPPPPP